MRHLLAGLTVAVLVAAPAQGAGGLTRAKAERLVERKAVAHAENLRADATCRRTGPRSFACKYAINTLRCDEATPDGEATVTQRRGHRPRVRLRPHELTTFCDSG